MSDSTSPEILTTQQMDMLHQRTLHLWEKIKDEQPSALFFLDKSAREFSFQLKILNRNQEEPLLLPPAISLNFGSEKTDLMTEFLLSEERRLKQHHGLSEEEQFTRDHLQKHAGTLKALRVVDIDNIRTFVKPEAYRELIAPFCTREIFVKLYGEENIARLETVVRDIPGEGQRLIIDDVAYTGFSQVLLGSILGIVDPSHEYQFIEMFTESELKQFTGEGLYLPWTKSGNPHYQSSQFIEDTRDPRSFVSQITANEQQRERAVQLRTAIRRDFSERKSE